jgi:hypothetical protein
VLVMARRRSLASRRLSVGHASCRFVSRVRLRSARLRGARRLTVTVRFAGNAALRPAALRGRRVRVRG